MADRKFGTEVSLPVVHYLSQRFTFADNGTTFTLGYLPEGAVVIDVVVIAPTAFDSGTSDVLIVGYTDDDNEFIATCDLQATGRIYDATTMNASVELYDTSEKKVTCKFTAAGTAATAGEAIVIVTFVPRVTAPS
jgi:hypothetical protein